MSWMDEALYLKNCYLKEFDAKIVSVDGNGKYIVLDKTLFYPNSGGQPHDTGKIIDDLGNEYNVVYVGKFNNHISHELDKPIDKGAIRIHGVIDWNRRYRLMRYHTAAHLLSGLIFRRFGAIITGNQLSLERSRIDFNLEKFDRELFLEVEKEANEWIKKGARVIKKILPKEEAEKIPDLVKITKGLPKDVDKIRVVEIEGLDIQACGGTHLDNISEINGIKIIKLENKGKHNRRMYFQLID